MMFNHKITLCLLIVVLGLTGFALIPTAAVKAQQNLPRQIFKISEGTTTIANVKIEISTLELCIVLTRPNQPKHTFRHIFQTQTVSGEVEGQTIFAVSRTPSGLQVVGNQQQIQAVFGDDMKLLRGIREHSPLTLAAEAGYVVAARAALSTVDDISGFPSNYVITTIETTYVVATPLKDCYKAARTNLNACITAGVTEQEDCYEVYYEIIIDCNKRHSNQLPSGNAS